MAALSTPLQRLRTEGPLGVMAVAVGAVSLTYPLGADQGLFFTTSREWLHGRVPYAEVFDHKWPFIWVIHMLVLAAFGEAAWGMRLAELLLVPVAGWLGARLAAPLGTRIPDGAIGAAWLGASVFYYGWFTFWDTAQCEIWYATLALASIVIVLRSERVTRARLLAAGALAGCAMFVKPTAAWFALVAAGGLVLRLRREGDRTTRRALEALATYAAGAALVAAAILGYFAARGALGAMVDVLVGANGTYVKNETGARSFPEIAKATFAAYMWLSPVSTLFLAMYVGALVAAVRLRRFEIVRRYAVPLALAIAALVTVVMQLKFYRYHWGTLVPAAATFSAMVYADLAPRAVAAGRRWATPLLFAFLSGLFLWASEHRGEWRMSNRRAYDWLTGKITRAEYAATFDIPELYFFYGDAEAIGAWLRAHLREDDTVLVRGFEAHMYALCKCRWSGRFYWSTFLTEPRRSYRRGEWTAEDEEEVARHPPRFAVALGQKHEGLESAEWFEARGYRRVADASTDAFVVLER